jgi:adenylate cyclase
MRVNVQFIEAEIGAHLWAERFDKLVADFFDMQVEFVSRPANSLGVELVRAEALRAMRERPNNPDAVDLSMRGWAELYRGSAFSKAGQGRRRSLRFARSQSTPNLSRRWSVSHRLWSVG